MISEFEAPIPGESLTTPPGSRPWERPPEISDPEEAIQMHLLRLSKPEFMEALVDAMELDVDITTLTEGLLRGAVAGGIHSIDVSLVVAPVVHEFIKSVGDAAGIEYDEGLVDQEEEAAKRKAITTAKAAKMVSKFRKENKTSMELPPEEPLLSTNEEPTPMPTEMPEEEGFMKRRPV